MKKYYTIIVFFIFKLFIQFFLISNFYFVPPSLVVMTYLGIFSMYSHREFSRQSHSLYTYTSVSYCRDHIVYIRHRYWRL